MIVGAKSRQPHDQAAQDATRQVTAQLTRSLRAKGIAVADLAAKVYDTAYFDGIMHGEYGVLSEVGVQQRMRAAIFTVIDARCQPANSIPGVISCSIIAAARFVRGDMTTSYADTLTETGAGATQEDAIMQAAQRLIELHPVLLSGT